MAESDLVPLMTSSPAPPMQHQYETEHPSFYEDDCSMDNIIAQYPLEGL
jgi:hypothetical protein